MKVRYIGPDTDGVDVVCSGRLIASGVKPDEPIEVPDEVYAAHAWSEDLWSVVAPPKRNSTPKELD